MKERIVSKILRWPSRWKVENEPLCLIQFSEVILWALFCFFFLIKFERHSRLSKLIVVFHKFHQKCSESSNWPKVSIAVHYSSVASKRQPNTRTNDDPVRRHIWASIGLNALKGRSGQCTAERSWNTTSQFNNSYVTLFFSKTIKTTSGQLSIDSNSLFNNVFFRSLQLDISCTVLHFRWKDQISQLRLSVSLLNTAY